MTISGRFVVNAISAGNMKLCFKSVATCYIYIYIYIYMHSQTGLSNPCRATNLGVGNFKTWWLSFGRICCKFFCFQPIQKAISGFIRPITSIRRSPLSVVANVLVCKVVVSNLESQSHYYFHLRTNTSRKVMNPLIPWAMCWIIPLLFLYKDGYGIK